MNSRPDTVAQLRGAFVGSLSGAVSIAAHAAGGGGMPPGEAAVVLLLTVCAVIGAAVSTVRVSRREFAFDSAVLAAGQVLGHATLMLASEHAHGGLGLSGPMVGAHALATVVAAALLRGAERACLAVIAALVEIVRAIVARFPAECRVWISTPVYRATLSRWLLAGAAVGTRAPPRAAMPSALALS